MDYNNINQLIKNKENEVNKLLLEINELKSKLNSKEIIQESLSDEEKINIFMDYFKGRDEVYPYLSIDKYNPNKKYYIPSCINEWKSGICNKTMKKPCRNCQYREDKPITKEVIYNHLYKNNPIGIYPMLDDDTCYFITFDFDDKENNNNIKDDVLAFSSVCDKYNVPIALEKSRSGNGIHIWIFFENKIKASIARKLGSLLLSKTMELRDNMNITTFDRMFPSQDFLPKGGYGNLIALPFQCEPSKYGNTLFYDRNFIRINNQFGYLKQLKKININEIFDIIKIISNETIDISNECINIKEEVKNKNKNLFDYPKYINVVLDNMVNIDKANLSGAVKNSFRRIASFANPEFYKNQRLRMSVYNIPMIISCSKETDKYLRLPRGTFEYLTDLCNEQNIQVNIIDKRNSGTNINVIFDGALREEQEKALEKLKEYENGILYAPTGFGKTVVSCKMIADKGINTLVITNKLQLLRQWQESIKKFLNINAGIICGGKNTITNIVDVASIKSIWNEGKFNDFVKNYGMIIIDECHHLAAFTYESAVNTVCAKYVYGVTATPERENGHTPIIKMQCGDIRYEVDFKKFNKELNIPMKVYKINNHLNFVNPIIQDYTINEINNFIVKDVIRSDKIMEKIIYEFNNKKNILILTERIEHLDYFKEKLLKITDNLFVYRGGIGKKQLNKYAELKESIIQNQNNKIILATGSYIGEGFDDSTLDVLFLTMPISGITKVIQYTGRLHRKDDNKKEIIIYDYVDDNFKQTRNMYEKRKKTYLKLGYELIED